MDPIRRVAATHNVPREVIARVVTNGVREFKIQLHDDWPDEGTPISLTEASGKYGIGLATLSRWVKAGRIRVIERQTNARGRPVMVEELDVAAAADGYEPRQGRRTDLAPTR